MKNKIKEMIDKSSSIVLLSHENPDGDAIGSLIAFYQFLVSINKSVDMISSKVPTKFNFLNGYDKILIGSKKKYDLAIILDCATKERIEFGNNNIEFNNSIVIDHHEGNTKYGNNNYIEGKVSSCCQILYYLFKSWNVLFNKNIGESLMVGVLTDTNGFKNDNVDKNTFVMVSEMMDIGVNIYNLRKKSLTEMTIPQYELMKLALNRLEFFYNGMIAFSFITKDDMERLNAQVGDHEGLVELGRDIVGVEVSIFMREDEGYRVSFRSNETVNVCEIAKIFGGNGHSRASGAKLEKTFNEAKNLVIEETIRALKKQ